jgi:transposase-like protein
VGERRLGMMSTINNPQCSNCGSNRTHWIGRHMAVERYFCVACRTKFTRVIRKTAPPQFKIISSYNGMTTEEETKTYG